MDKFILFDGSNISHIAFHRAKSIVLKEIADKNSIRQRDIKSEDLDEDALSSIQGMMFHVFFLKMHKIFKKYRNCKYIFTWDAPGATKWRKEQYSEYKSNRVYTEDSTWKILFEGIDQIKKVLRHYPVFQVEYESLEADDILYEYSRQIEGEVVVVTTDSDLVQVAQKFKNVKILDPIKMKYKEVPTTYDVCVYKSLDGEKGDGIPGVKGYGKKKSKKLAEEIKKNPDAINKLTEEERVIFERNLNLIDISCNERLYKASLDVKEMLRQTTLFDSAKIKKFYFDKKLKQLLETFDQVESIFA